MCDTDYWYVTDSIFRHSRLSDTLSCDKSCRINGFWLYIYIYMRVCVCVRVRACNLNSYVNNISKTNMWLEFFKRPAEWINNYMYGGLVPIIARSGCQLLWCEILKCTKGGGLLYLKAYRGPGHSLIRQWHICWYLSMTSAYDWRYLSRTCWL